MKILVSGPKGFVRRDVCPEAIDKACFIIAGIELSPNGPNVTINIPIGPWHSIRAFERGSVVLAVKDGAEV